MAKTDILRAICSKGGMILYDNLADMGLSPLEELKRTISRNPDTFSEVYLGGQVFVTARSNISLCEMPDCLGCERLHMCEGYLLGSCDDNGCCFSHDLYSEHNIWVLKQYGLQGLKEHEISVLLFRDETPPAEEPQLFPPAPHHYPPQPPIPIHGLIQPPPPEMPDYTVLGSDDICQMNLIHRCSAGGQCNKLHSNTSYMWQRRHGKQWWALPNNEEIERDYCDPVKTKHYGSPPVDFDLMYSGSDEVRRLSVTSADFHTASLLITKWAWYWELSEDQWKEYAAPCEMYFEQEGKKDNLIITSEKLEQKYQEGATSFQFARGETCYILSFTDMIQTNQSTDMKRLVRRRPVLISPAEIQKVCEKYEKIIQPNFLSSVPPHWNRSLLPGTGYERVKMEASSQDYKSILRQFNKTLRKGNILSIERIQNLKLWRFFILQKNQMKNDAGKDVQIQRLFHGTESEYIDAVCHGNIDWSFGTVKDTRFGKGCYFAKDASYANEHTDKQGVRFMFLCQVMVGEYALGKPDYYRPPFKDERKTVSFDSCVDDLRQPSLYVIFERNQTYPEFLIKYKLEAEETTSVRPPLVQTPRAQSQPEYEYIQPVLPEQHVQQWPILPPSPLPPKPCDCDCDCKCGSCCLM